MLLQLQHQRQLLAGWELPGEGVEGGHVWPCHPRLASHPSQMEEILHQFKNEKHPIVFGVSTIQGGVGFRKHPQYETLCKT